MGQRQVWVAYATDDHRNPGEIASLRGNGYVSLHERQNVGTTRQSLEWLDTDPDVPVALRAYLAPQLVLVSHRGGLVRCESAYLSEAKKH